MKRLIAALSGLGLLLFVGLGGGSAAGNPTTNGSNAQSNSVKTITHTCTDRSTGGGMSGDDMDNDGDTISFSGATVLWPPNHKYRTVTITATDTDTATELVDNDYTTLTTMATSNQPELGGGSGHTLDDTNPAAASTSGSESASQDIQLRGERAGHDPLKAGRTYTITAMATFDGMGTMPNSSEHCNATFTVTVPHDMGNR
jgi:hypothetical protein